MFGCGRLSAIMDVAEKENRTRRTPAMNENFFIIFLHCATIDPESPGSAPSFRKDTKNIMANSSRSN